MKNIYFWFCCFFCLFAFYHSNAQTIIKQDGKFGLADQNGNMIHKPIYDSIYRMSKFTEINFFYIKQNNKYAYCYYQEFDSITSFSESQKKWISSGFEFDSLLGFWIGTSHYKGGFSYTTIGYKKEGLWGMLIVQTHTGSGSGIFPSAGFFVDGVGKLIRRKNKYDQITISEKDDFYTTRLNSKYGFWEPITNEEYEPEFDSIPIVKIKDFSSEELPRHRFVKKDGKWGLVYLNEQTKKIEYKVPCLCNGLGNLNAELYYCMGQNDTLRFYSTKTKQTFKPLIDGKPIITTFYWRPWNNAKFNYQAYIGNPGWLVGTDGTFYYLNVKYDRYITLNKENNTREFFPVVANNFQDKTTTSVYVIDMQQNKITLSFTDTTCSYFSGYAPLIVKAHYDDKTKKYTREFYDDQTGVLKFSITTSEKFLFIDDIKKETPHGQTTWYKFTSSRTTSSDHGVVRGYYNLTTKKFSKRRK